MMRSITHSMIYILCIYLSNTVYAGVGSVLPAPYSKSYLTTPQEYIHTYGINSNSPPEKLPFVQDILQSRTTGGVIIYWSKWYNHPQDVIAQIPGIHEPTDLLNLIHELRSVYGVEHVGEQLQVTNNSGEIKNDRNGVFGTSKEIYLQHICQLNGQTIPVVGSRFVATLVENHLIRLSSSFRPVSCGSPQLIAPQKIKDEYPNMDSALPQLKLYPAGIIHSEQTDTYVYEFTQGGTFYRIRAHDGVVIHSSSTEAGVGSGAKRVVKEVANPPLGGSNVCVEVNFQPLGNNSGGPACIDPWNHLYNSMFWGLRSWNGMNYFRSWLGPGASWGQQVASDKDISAIYRAVGPDNATSIPLEIAKYSSGRISFYRYTTLPPAPGSNRVTVDMITQATSSTGAVLPGIGGAVDIVGHEIGHGYIHTLLQHKNKTNPRRPLSGGAHQYGQGLSSPQNAGEAITEGLADVFGKIAEMYARYDNAGCTPTPTPVSPCGQPYGLSQACGSTYCFAGEYCDDPTTSTCKVCHAECPQSPKAVLLGTFGRKYHTNNAYIFTSGKGLRRLNDPDQWQINCNHDDKTMKYGNSLFLSGLILSYSLQARDLLYKNAQGVGVKGFIRNQYDIAFQEFILRHVLRHLELTTNVPRAVNAYLATLPVVVRTLYKHNEKANAYKVWKMVMTAIPYHNREYPGKCPGGKYKCKDNSPYICLRPKGQLLQP